VASNVRDDAGVFLGAAQEDLVDNVIFASRYEPISYEEVASWH
jgi:hypothetical protein